MESFSDQLAEFRAGAWRAFTGQTDLQRQAQETASKSQTRAAELSERAALRARGEDPDSGPEELAVAAGDIPESTSPYASSINPYAAKLRKRNVDDTAAGVAAILSEPDEPRVSTGVMAIPQPEVSTGAMATEEPTEEDSPQVDFKGLPGSRANNPLASAPAVVEAEAQSEINTGIVSGGQVIQDKNGWSYKYFEDSGNVQILTAPESNKSAVGMVLTPNESNPERQSYYTAIADFSKKYLASPSGMLSEEAAAALSPEATAMPDADTMETIEEAGRVEAAETPDPVPAQESEMSASDARRSARRMRRRNRKEEAKNIAERLIKKNVGGLADTDIG